MELYHNHEVVLDDMQIISKTAPPQRTVRILKRREDLMNEKT